MKISIEADVSAVKSALAGTKRGMRSAARAMIRVVARGTVKAIKSGIRATTKRRTGAVFTASGSRPWNRGAGAPVRPRGAKGCRIYPNVYWLNTGRKHDRLAPRHFVQRGNEWASNPANWDGEAEAIVRREIAKYWG